MAVASKTAVIAFVLENASKETISDDQLCKSLAHCSTAKKKSKKKSKSLSEGDVNLYTGDIIVITRSDIELKAREEENAEIKPNLETYHVNNLSDFIENKLDDLQHQNKAANDTVYVVLHELCDHLEDIKKLHGNNMEIRSIIHLRDAQHEQHDNAVIAQLTNQAIYDSHGDALRNITVHELALNVEKANKPQDVTEACQEIRKCIHQIQAEWTVYDANWQKNECATLDIPKVAAQDMDVKQYDVYNQCMDSLQSPDVCSVLHAMIQQLSANDDANDDEQNANETAPNDRDQEAGVHRFSDILSQNGYLNNVAKQQLSWNQKSWQEFSTHFVKCLFAENEDIDTKKFEFERNKRYTFSKLEPIIFDDALICDAFNELLSAKQTNSSVSQRVYREELSAMEFIQRVYHLSNNTSLDQAHAYLKWMDAILLMYYVPSTRCRQSSIDAFLCSRLGFRKWMQLPAHLKAMKPHAFYKSDQAHFLQQHLVKLYPAKNWFLGLSSLNGNAPHLYLHDASKKAVITVTKPSPSATHFNAHFGDDTQLVYTQEVLYLSLPNELVIEYHYATHDVVMYYQPILNEYHQKLQEEEQKKHEQDATKEEAEKAEANPQETENTENNENEVDSADFAWTQSDGDDVLVVWRKMDECGAITVYYSDHSQRKLFPNSEVWHKRAGSSTWTEIKSNGECVINEQTQQRRLQMATTTDSESDTKIVTREDNVLVFCQCNGDGFVQYPDSTHLFVKSNISSKEWNLHQLAQWMQNLGVNVQSSYQIANLSPHTIEETAEKLKTHLTRIRFELKNDAKMPTIEVDTVRKQTKIEVYPGFDLTFSHHQSPCLSVVNHCETGKLEVLQEKHIRFTPRDESQSFDIDLNAENPRITFKDTFVSMNGEMKHGAEEEIEVAFEPRMFVVHRDGSGYELLSNEQVDAFRQYLSTYTPTPQILEPQPLLLSAASSEESSSRGTSHKFVMERVANNAPRERLEIPSVLGQSLNTKLSGYKDADSRRSCHIYRHLLQTPPITNEQVEMAKNDLSNFENWLREQDVVDDEVGAQEVLQKQDVENVVLASASAQKTQSDTEVKQVPNAQPTDSDQQSIDAQDEKAADIDVKGADYSLTNEQKGREIRRRQLENQQKADSNGKSLSSYFENEPFLRDYEINQTLLQIFASFVNSWRQKPIRRQQTQREEQMSELFVDTLSLLRSFCDRLRQIISAKTLDANLKTLSLTEQLMLSMQKNQFLNAHLDNLLYSVGFRLSDETGYVPEQSNIFIDAGICYLTSKLDEFHVKFKTHLLEHDENLGTTANETKRANIKQSAQSLQLEMKPEDATHEVSNATDLMHSPSHSMMTEKPALERCTSHCTCCPIDSPNRAAKMDYLGRSRKNIVCMDELDNYGKEVSSKELNYRYLETESGVQPRLCTASTTLMQSVDPFAAFPTVVIQPNVFDFGTLLAGYVYRFSATVTNHGNTQARLKVECGDAQSSEHAHDIHLKPYYRSGIAPGITIALEIELCAANAIGQYLKTLTIKTQKHVFHVDVTANIVEDDGHVFASMDATKQQKQRVSCLGRKC